MNRHSGFFVGVALLLSACGDQAPVPPLRIGVIEWTGFYPVMRAQVDGSFATAGVQTTTTVFPDNPSLLQALANGEVDVAGVVWTDVIRRSGNGDALRAVAVADWSDHGDVLLASPAVTEPRALAGKRIACEGVHSFSHLFVLAVLAKYGIPEVEVRLVDMPASEVPKALQEGRIDAGHTWGPLAESAIATGCRVIDHAGAVPGSITDVLAVRQSTMLSRATDLRRLVAVFYAAQPQDAAARETTRRAAATMLGKELSTISPIGTEAHLVGALAARTLMTDQTGPAGLHVSGEKIVGELAKRGQLPADFSVNGLVDTTFLPVP